MERGGDGVGYCPGATGRGSYFSLTMTTPTGARYVIYKNTFKCAANFPNPLCGVCVCVRCLDFAMGFFRCVVWFGGDRLGVEWKFSWNMLKIVFKKIHCKLYAQGCFFRVYFSVCFKWSLEIYTNFGLSSYRSVFIFYLCMYFEFISEIVL